MAKAKGLKPRRILFGATPAPVLPHAADRGRAQRRHAHRRRAHRRGRLRLPGMGYAHPRPSPPASIVALPDDGGRHRHRLRADQLPRRLLYTVLDPRIRHASTDYRRAATRRSRTWTRRRAVIALAIESTELEPLTTATSRSRARLRRLARHRLGPRRCWRLRHPRPRAAHPRPERVVPRARPPGPGSAGTSSAATHRARLLARIIWGTRASFVVAFGAVAFGLVVGGFLGLVAGFFRGRIDGVISRSSTSSSPSPSSCWRCCWSPCWRAGRPRRQHPTHRSWSSWPSGIVAIPLLGPHHPGQHARRGPSASSCWRPGPWAPRAGASCSATCCPTCCPAMAVDRAARRRHRHRRRGRPQPPRRRRPLADASWGNIIAEDRDAARAVRRTSSCSRWSASSSSPSWR